MRAVSCIAIQGAACKTVALAFLLILHPAVAGAQALVRPEVVRFENVRINGEVKTVTVGNPQHHYSLFCNVKASGCITTDREKNYLLFDAKTRWKMPGAKHFLTLAFVQDWTGQIQRRRGHRSRSRRECGPK